ncbi:MAG: peptidoglycan editing factor PgeF [Chloroflexi bacterium]|nr:peptidoglycan editing factor PgeF [Chloroflexota bacterium]MBI3733502.1 peptidoglycan editing factor PgeF [Chloroflexota bacterium]
MVSLSNPRMVSLSNPMIRHEHGRVVAYAFQTLSTEPTVAHAVFTRHGGVSPAPWQSLNLSTGTGDSAENVAENTRRVVETLGWSPADAVTSRQVHGAQVAVVGRDHRARRIADSDGLITDSPGVVLLQRYADCAPILLYDPERPAVGVAHAGWRGTLAGIAGVMVKRMGEAFGSKPGSLVACIGPAIGQCCYHVGAEVQQLFSERHALGANCLHPRGGRVYLDLWEANRSQLHEAGVRQVEVAGLCTSCNTGDFYSARAENRLNGCFGAVIALRDNGGL